MNIFGWKSTGRGLLRPAKARVRQDRLSGVRAYGQTGLFDCGADRDQHPARSLFEQALCPFLRDQKAGRRGHQFRSDQADEVRCKLSAISSPTQARWGGFGDTI